MGLSAAVQRSVGQAVNRAMDIMYGARAPVARAASIRRARQEDVAMLARVMPLAFLACVAVLIVTGLPGIKRYLKLRVI
jgi:hypothetical protein